MPTSVKPKCKRPAARSTPQVDPRAILARRLEILAGCELHHRHHDAAEHLAWRAAALREAAQ